MIRTINMPKSRGFQLKFDNNYTVSVLYGSFHGCEHYMDFSSNLESSPNAEVTVLSPTGELVWFGSPKTDIVEKVSAETIGEIISAVQTFKPSYSQSSLEKALGMIVSESPK